MALAALRLPRLHHSDEFGDAPLLSGISVFELVAGMVFGIPTDELQQLGFINNAGLGGVVNGSIVFGAELGLRRHSRLSLEYAPYSSP